MFKINLQGDEEIYSTYVEQLKKFDIGRRYSNKYSLRAFSSELFENLILNLTEDMIISTLKGLETSEYYKIKELKIESSK